MLRLIRGRCHRYPGKKLVIAVSLFVLSATAFVLYSRRREAVNAALYNAVNARDVEGVRDALEQGADPNMMADARGRHFTLLQFLSFWKDKNPQIHSVPILMAALGWSTGSVYNSHPANQLVPAAAERTRQQTPQMLAIVRLLLQHGTHVDTEDSRGQTALLMASGDGVPQLVTCLLNNCADVKHLDHENRSALYVAVFNFETSTARLLLQRGADPNTQLEHNDFTPMMMAVIDDDEELTKLLLEAGADVTIRDRDGHTVFTYQALDHFSPETRHLINLSIRRYRNTKSVQK